MLKTLNIILIIIIIIIIAIISSTYFYDVTCLYHVLSIGCAYGFKATTSG